MQALVGELVAFNEIVETLRVSRRTARAYINRSDFPAPVDELAVGRIWRRNDVEAWAAAKLPLPLGRPRKPHG